MYIIIIILAMNKYRKGRQGASDSNVEFIWSMNFARIRAKYGL